ncbi:hypothetical protein PVAND_005352 [Polypedilum vanderplanki]|uniref:C2H2-type domain-containing protein n=1 Tax=Polypedilum vanderplanki TaxID=319348 RepID=A0A9J6C0L1_POLVA|nr:hypothetical protein PVAND_005352 [Polypedilum vanderplanki]
MSQNKITEINVKLEKPAKIVIGEIKTIDNESQNKQLPADNQNNDLNRIDCNIKTEINVEDELEVFEISVNNKDRSANMKRSADIDIEIECTENPEIKKIKTEQNELTRRRSLRNETAASIKKKPPKYEEIFNCYKRKEYKECIIYLELVNSMAKDCIEYSILKAACYIHLGQKISEAHKILDDVLKLRPDNVFTIYAKGLASFQEQRWKESIKYFEKALELDKSSMERAEVMLKISKEQLDKEESEQEKISSPAEEEDEAASEEEEIDPEEEEEEESETNSEYDDDNDDENQSTVKESKHAMNIRNKRFGCELCGNKYFGKKFNLDRHNRTIHNRDTPYIAPLPRNYGRRKTSSGTAKIKKEKSEEPIENKEETANEEEAEEENDNDYEDIDDELVDIPISKKKPKFKIRLGSGKVTKAASLSLPSLAPLKAGMARCKVCKKMYRKGSLARHEIIHTGNKPHKCDQCPMAFYQKSDLQRHLTIHSDNFDFECELCDKKFRIKKNLQVHNKRHHSNIV